MKLRELLSIRTKHFIATESHKIFLGDQLLQSKMFDICSGLKKLITQEDFITYLYYFEMESVN
jgi:hypothetical protein